VPEIVFSNSKCVFQTKYHGEVTLSQAKWNIICQAPERRYYCWNGEKIATTLINPDIVRRHREERTQFLYYKKFATLYLQQGIEVPAVGGIFFTVILDESTSRVCTVYPVKEPKPGKAFVGTKL
jgi:hypothetical protein